MVSDLIQRTLEGSLADPSYGGNRNRAGWTLIGFPGPLPYPQLSLTTMAHPDVYDVIVVGSGAGGGPLTLELTQAGARVLVLEEGSGAAAAKS